MITNTLKALFLVMLFPLALFGQHTISGTVVDAESGETLIGANVWILGQNQGASTNINGKFTIENVKDGDYEVRASIVGFISVTKQITVKGSDLKLDFELEAESVTLDELQVFASRSDQSTPVAFTTVDKEEIKAQLGSRDLPNVLNIVPSVYSTNQGGGSGDARINVRGFDQTNVAVMINGVPVNDMENGWVYWSNWDGVGDVASSIQVQRGASNVNLATPSVGGTLNILSDPANQLAGGSVKVESSSGNFQKKTVILNTGLINDKFAFSAVGVRKTGDGLVEGTWTDAWAYYLGATYKINDKNQLDLFAFGAPQRHGQNLYKQNIATYSHSYARDLGYSADALAAFPEKGRFFNQNVSPVSSSYDGRQYLGDNWIGASVQDRYDNTLINERENFFHKPQVNLNWYSQLSDKLSLTNVLYYSGGNGGGTGTYGSSPVSDFSYGAYKVLWDETIARNIAADEEAGKEAYQSTTILRNSRNDQVTFGDILKLSYKVDDALKIHAGLDWRTAEIDHYREIRDLLGGRFFVENGQRLGLGDVVNYNFTNTVDWLGTYVMADYATDKLSAYATAGYSTIKYTYKNHMNNALNAKPDAIGGYQLKAGAQYFLNNNLAVYGNIARISKVPIFDNVVNDGSGAINEDPENEKFNFFEGGLKFYDNSGRFGMNVNAYLTDRKDRSFTRNVNTQGTRDAIVNITGLDQRHTGFEVEMSYEPNKFIRLDVAASHNLWKYTNDVTARYQADQSSQDFTEIFLTTKDLKVGNAPQSQYAYTLSVMPTKNLDIKLVGTSFLRHYAEFDPLTRTATPGDASTEDRAQTWHVPNYSVFNLHINYQVDSVLKGANFFFNVFNVFDEMYIQDAVDNSRYNGYSDNGTSHGADDAEVFFGLPRNMNFGVNISF